MPSDLVGQNEIANRADVKVGTVRAWRTRHADFPAPTVELAIGPVWEWEPVAAWLERERKTGRPAK